MLQEMGEPRISRVLWEGNKCANLLAKDAKALLLLFSYQLIPNCIKPQLLADMMGVSYPRTLYA